MSNSVVTEDRVRQFLSAVPGLLRTDRPASAILPWASDAAQSLFSAQHSGGALVRPDGSCGPVRCSCASGTGATSGDALLEVLYANDGVVRLSDVEPAAVGLPETHPPIRQFLGTRLHRDGRSVGALFVCDPFLDDGWSSADEQLAALVGAIVGTALSNADLLREALLARRWLSAATSITNDLFAGNLDEPLGLICARARELAEADVVALLLLDEEAAPDGAPRVTVRCGRGLDVEQKLLGVSFPIDGTWTGRVLGRGRAEVVSDLSSMADVPLHRAGGVELGPAMMVPLLGANAVRGALLVARRADALEFSTADLEVAGGFGHHAALSLELAAGRETAEHVRLLEERNRIGRDLHDHVVQRLFACGLSLQQALNHPATPLDDSVAERIRGSVGTLDETIRQIRNTILTLRSVEETATLGVLVDSVAREAAPLLGFTPTVALESPASDVVGTLAADLAVSVREGVSNIVRHAHASAVEIRAVVDEPELQLTLRDDGVGIHSDRRSGLANLSARARQHGGTFEAVTPPEGGTLLTWRVPLPRQRSPRRS